NVCGCRIADAKGPDMIQGTVDRVDLEGKFGFIVGPNGEEYFFHMDALEGPEWGEMGPGVTVQFNVAEDPGDEPSEGLRATEIMFAPDAIPADDNEPVPPEKFGT